MSKIKNNIQTWHTKTFYGDERFTLFALINIVKHGISFYLLYNLFSLTKVYLNKFGFKFFMFLFGSLANKNSKISPKIWILSNLSQICIILGTRVLYRVCQFKVTVCAGSDVTIFVKKHAVLRENVGTRSLIHKVRINQNIFGFFWKFWRFQPHMFSVWCANFNFRFGLNCKLRIFKRGSVLWRNWSYYEQKSRLLGIWVKIVTLLLTLVFYRVCQLEMVTC